MNKNQWLEIYNYVIKKDLEAAENRESIKKIYSWVLRRDNESMKKYFDQKKANRVDLGKLYLNWNKLARGY